MNAKFKSRLQELELDAEERRRRRAREIMEAAFGELSQENLDALRNFLMRLPDSKGMEDKLGLERALATCTPDETAAIECFNKAGEEAALRLYGRPLLGVKAKHVILRPRHLQ